ncbi:hypothetical protein EAI_15955 [Harpegnathos saltator]|uniref:Uncharacterized protein n=1 Tax=Harpegnathos saltator TaxID=610380 RepID=E2BRX2_HARSA|nr:hypothetical protein EAI_15955 [Harpegnathos saltator]
MKGKTFNYHHSLIDIAALRTLMEPVSSYLGQTVYLQGEVARRSKVPEDTRVSDANGERHPEHIKVREDETTSVVSEGLPFRTQRPTVSHGPEDAWERALNSSKQEATKSLPREGQGLLRALKRKSSKR